MFSFVVGFVFVEKTTTFLVFPTVFLTLKRIPVLMQAYACSKLSTLPYSRLIFFSNSRRRTGNLWKRLPTDAVVPFCPATICVCFNFPDVSKSNLFAFGAWSAWAVMIWKFERAHSDERASPRN